MAFKSKYSGEQIEQALEKAINNELFYVEGTSDGDGYIKSDIVPQTEGYTTINISMMFLHPELNIWCPCMAYQAITGNEDVVVTGGLRGSAVVLGGSVQAKTFSNCKYRVYYIKHPIQ